MDKEGPAHHFRLDHHSSPGLVPVSILCTTRIKYVYQ